MPSIIAIIMNEYGECGIVSHFFFYFFCNVQVTRTKHMPPEYEWAHLMNFHSAGRRSLDFITLITDDFIDITCSGGWINSKLWLI